MSSILKDTVLKMFRDGKSKRAISIELGIPRSTVRRWLSETTEDDIGIEIGQVPLSEVAIPKLHEATAQETLDDLRFMAEANPEKTISRNYYRVHGKYSESAWSQYWGTFHEYKRQAGIVLTRQQHNLEKNIAKHASVDRYRKFGDERLDYAESYIVENKSRYKTVLVASDFHDKECDKFFLKVFLDTAKRIQPDVICLLGDVFDLAEFGRYVVDPREWDVVGRIKFVHEHILEPLREACPNSQLDMVEGNHEYRLLRHLSDATPALKVVLSDLHGMTVSSLLGLDKYKVNYICKADLSAYTKGDINKEVSKNYKVYFDSMLVHHFTEGKSLGVPGINGHHHKVEVSTLHNETFGSYQWVQNGSGHHRDASYCNGEKWSNGFTIATIDTLTKRTVFDVIDIKDFAVVGGKYYFRD